MKFLLKYHYVQGKVRTTHCVEADSIEEVIALGEELYKPDGWNHWVHVQEALPWVKPTMLIDGTKIPEEKKIIKKKPGRQLQIQHVHASSGDDRPY